jgi:hypothetical protein
MQTARIVAITLTFAIGAQAQTSDDRSPSSGSAQAAGKVRVETRAQCEAHFAGRCAWVQAGSPDLCLSRRCKASEIRERSAFTHARERKELITPKGFRLAAALNRTGTGLKHDPKAIATTRQRRSVVLRIAHT